jgi:hypothetical protein
MGKNINDIIKEVAEETSQQEVETKDLEILDNIKGVIQELKGDGVTGKTFDMYTANELSKLNGTVAILKFSLGEILAKYSRIFKLNEEKIKICRANWRESVINDLTAEKKRPTVDDINSELDKRVFREKVKSIFKEENYEKALYLWRSINSMIEVIQTRIQILSSEKYSTKFSESGLNFDLSEEQKNLNK